MKTKVKFDLDVIIPVHNSAKYLSNLFKCLESQSYENFRLIFVENNSSDNSLELLSNFEKNTNIPCKIISTNKKGSAKARNEGLEASDSEYIMFVDSDDEFDENYIKLLIEKIKEDDSDIAICAFKREEEETFKQYKPEMCINHPINLAFINTALWNKVFKSAIIKENKLPCIRVCEDALFFYNLLDENVKIAYLPQVLYTYIIRKNSLMNTITIEEVEEVLKEFENFYYKSKLTQKMLMIYIHIALSMPLGIAQNNGQYKNANSLVRKMLYALDAKWYQDKCFSFKALGGVTLKNILIKCSIYAVRLKAMDLLISLYRIVVNLFKKQIKW